MVGMMTSAWEVKSVGIALTFLDYVGHEPVSPPPPLRWALRTERHRNARAGAVEAQQGTSPGR
jgi:hypothetical protein